MTELILSVTHAEGEDPVSLLSRLGARNGRDLVSEFSKDVGLDLLAITARAHGEVTKLARMSSDDPESLVTASLVRLGPHRHRLHGQDLATADLHLGRMRVCAACLCEDVASPSTSVVSRPYLRSVWMLSGIHVCPIHHRELVPIEHGYGRHPRDASAIIKPYIFKLGSMREASRMLQPTGFETYLLDRISRRATNLPWLDQMPFNVASEVCGVIGATMLLGGNSVLDDASVVRRRDVAELGFQVASGSDGSRRRHVDSSMRVICEPKSWEGRGIFGALYDWTVLLGANWEFEPLRDLLRSSAWDTLGVPKEKDIFADDFRVGALHRACRTRAT